MSECSPAMMLLRLIYDRIMYELDEHSHTSKSSNFREPEEHVSDEALNVLLNGQCNK